MINGLPLQHVSILVLMIGSKDTNSMAHTQAYLFNCPTYMQITILLESSL